jgi:hypothetical protein
VGKKQVKKSSRVEKTIYQKTEPKPVLKKFLFFHGSTCRYGAGGVVLASAHAWRPVDYQWDDERLRAVDVAAAHVPLDHHGEAVQDSENHVDP